MQNLNSLPDKYLQSNFPKWIFWSRVSQFVFSLFVFALCAYATGEFKIGSVIVVSPFVGLNMFTAFLTIIVVPYTFIAPRKLPNFYHVYGEVVLEFFLFFFWLISFSAMADWVGTFVYLSVLDVVDNFTKAANSLKAVTVFGAIVFFFSLANFIFLLVHVVKMRRARKSPGGHTNPEVTENEMERADKTDPVALDDMPPSFNM